MGQYAATRRCAMWARVRVKDETWKNPPRPRHLHLLLGEVELKYLMNRPGQQSFYKVYDKGPFS